MERTLARAPGEARSPASGKARRGVLGCSELYGGLDWLGMELKPEQIYAIMRNINPSTPGPAPRRGQPLYSRGGRRVRERRLLGVREERRGGVGEGRCRMVVSARTR